MRANPDIRPPLPVTPVTSAPSVRPANGWQSDGYGTDYFQMTERLKG